ncbi:MAG TPA: hypothetical protein DCE44_23460 [Verrucomicrobiales bacterium]|nr:hypothetical protein [Verrucomicrobiales bacterium]
MHPVAKQSAPKLKKGKYSDGHPLDDLHYLECKLILNGDRFTSVNSFYEFAKLVKQAAAVADVDFSRKGFKDLRPAIREVLFLDTADFRLYNNAFILRRRQDYVDGFAVGDPEIVFKFRHPDLQKAAEMDVRPKIAGDYQIKFKAEALPLKDKIGGYRILFSHNAQFPLSAIHDDDPMAMSTLVRMLPALETLKLNPEDKIELVNQTAVEEVLLDIGMLDFGKGVQAKSNVAVWRTRGNQKQLVGEFAFQAKMERRSELHAVAKLRCEQFFIAIQHVAEQWLALGTTKTGAVYRLKGNPPTAHE